MVCPYCATPQRIGPSYEVVDEIGQGQFGRVFKVTNPDLGENGIELAVKLLDALLSGSPEARGELKLLWMLPRDDENLVRVYPHSCRNYIVMEYVPGKDLHYRVRHQFEETVRNFDKIFKGICNGLLGIHNNGLAHRDLKPKNVLITDDWTAKIVDMGLAKLISESSPGRSKVGSLVLCYICFEEQPPLPWGERIEVRGDRDHHPHPRLGAYTPIKGEGEQLANPSKKL